ncbi:MAG: sulfatase-like hydrolase/transferase [Marmoricola sp.]
MRRRTVALVGAALAATVTIGGGHLATAAPARPQAASPAAAVKDSRPNIVLVLMDDFSLELLATMPQARRMQAAGASYRNAHSVDSLCCPSRTSLFTGRPPHQTGVLTNTANGTAHPIGGYKAFNRYGNAPKAFNVALHRSGYTTGFVGKYLNGYDKYTNAEGQHFAPGKVPGWSEFEAILSGGYPGWGFWSTRLDPSGRVRIVRTAKPRRTAPAAVRDRAYATNVASDRAARFLARHRDDDRPYFLEVATYGPHAQMRRAYRDNPPFPSAFADRAPRGDPTGGNCGTRPCGDLTLADLKGYADPRDDNAPTYLRRHGATSPAPAWNTNPINLSDRAALTHYRDRARMVQSIDRMVGRLRAAAGPDTYFFLTSDNGFHLGQLQLNGGKGTPYDADTHIPLVVTGPGVRQGSRSQFVSTLDLSSTFESLAGLRSPAYRSGNSFAESLHRPRAAGGRFVFFEHTYAKSRAGEVDADNAVGGDIESIPSYIGVRGKRGLLVRVDLDNSWRGTDHAWELYRYDVPWEDRNVFAEDHDKPWARELMRRLRAWEDCAPAECRTAAR